MLPFDLMKQPTLGIISSVLVILVSLGFISIFRLPTFTTWVAYLMICLIPMVVVISVTWAAKHPAFAVRHAQPARGLLFVLLLLAAGASVALVHFVAVGGSVSPPTPMVSMCIITTVVVAFWFAIVWGGWPFSRLMKNPAAGLLMLVAGYVVNYLLFRLFFNYGFMKGTPAYRAGAGPAWAVQRLERGGLFRDSHQRDVPAGVLRIVAARKTAGADPAAAPGGRLDGNHAGNRRPCRLRWRSRCRDGSAGFHGARANPVRVRHHHRHEHDGGISFCPVSQPL